MKFGEENILEIAKKGKIFNNATYLGTIIIECLNLEPYYDYINWRLNGSHNLKKKKFSPDGWWVFPIEVLSFIDPDLYLKVIEEYELDNLIAGFFAEGLAIFKVDET